MQSRVTALRLCFALGFAAMFTSSFAEPYLLDSSPEPNHWATNTTYVSIQTSENLHNTQRLTRFLQTLPRSSIHFSGLPWLSSANEVKTQLDSQGFIHMKTNHSGDEFFQGFIAGERAFVTALMDDKQRLVKVQVMFTTPNQLVQAKYRELEQRFRSQYGSPGTSATLMSVWVHGVGTGERTVLGLSLTEKQTLFLTYESPFWVWELERRRNLAKGLS